MSDEQDKLKLSLEPPKLFGRKKKPAEPAGSSAPAKPARPAVTKPVAPKPAPVPEPEAVIEPEPVPETIVEPEPEPVAAEPVPQPAPAPARAPEPVIEVEVEPEPLSEAEIEDAEIAALAAAGPLLTAYRAAALTGLVVGAAMVVLTWLSLRGCEAVRGTSSCGGGPGFLLLVATFAVCVVLGSQLLKTFQIPDPGSSSFLAVGLVAVVALLFLIDFLDNWSMLIVIPVLSIGGYLASVWVTKTFVEPVDT